MIEQAIQSDPETEFGYYNLADYYVRRKDWKNALSNYERVLSINPANSTAAVEKGRIQLQAGDADPAIETLNQALELNPQSFDAYMLLSQAYEKMNDTKEALAAADEAERIQPDSAEPKEAIRRLNATCCKSGA
jgi:tetratricopeptide (TPR) repeat protein